MHSRVSLSPGNKLGPYEILGPLGAGGMGEVYKARDTRLDRTVAIKVLPSHLSADPERRERFEREARVISSLNHPNICTLYDIGQHEGTNYLVMEYLEGESLAERLAKDPDERWSTAHDLLLQLRWLSRHELQTSEESTTRRRSRHAFWIASSFAVFAVLALSASLLYLRPASTDQEVVRFSIHPQPGSTFLTMGYVQTVTSPVLSHDGHGGTWNRDGIIVFAPSAESPLFRVPALGGKPSAVTQLAPPPAIIWGQTPKLLRKYL